MSMDDPEERKEKAAVLDHIARASFPISHLAPWMSVHKERQALVIAGMKTIADIGKELDRRVWLDRNPDEPFPEELREEADRKAETEAKVKLIVDKLKKAGLNETQIADALEPIIEAPNSDGDSDSAGDDDEEDRGPHFDTTRVRGASGMFGYCVSKYGEHLHDMAPSIGGLGRKQAMALGMAQRSGVATEQKERSLWEKLRGKGKDKDKVAGAN